MSWLRRIFAARGYLIVTSMCLVFALAAHLRRDPRKADSPRSDGPTRGFAAPKLLEVPRITPPTSAFKDAVDVKELAIALDRLRPLSPKRQFVSILVATHALRLWGSDAGFSERPYMLPGSDLPLHQFSSQTMLGLLVDGEKFKAMYDFARPFLARSSYGISTRQKLSEFNDRPVKTWPDYEAHIDKVISVLAETAVSTSHPVMLEDGSLGVVGDLVRDSSARFSLNQELEFSCLAYLLYMELPAKWTNRYGEQMSMNRILDKILKQDLLDGACGGTHGCRVLALASRIDQETPFLDDAIRERITYRLRMVSRYLELGQQETGGWAPNWVEGSDNLPLVVADGYLPTQLRVMGHHLEWISIAPSEMRPSDGVVRSAIAYLQDQMASIPPGHYFEHYTLLTHAARCLVLLSHEDPVQLLHSVSKL